MRALVWIGAGAFAALAGAAWAGDRAGAAIKLTVESPAYAGMPIWLDIDTDNICPVIRPQVWQAPPTVEPGGTPATGNVRRNNWDVALLTTDPTTPPEMYGPNGDHPDIMFGNQPAPAAAYPFGGVVYRGYDMMRACPSGDAKGRVDRRRILLNLVASFDRPGNYRVRWVTPDLVFPKQPHAGPEWVSFTVMPSTPARRDAWLTGLLTNPPALEYHAVPDNVLSTTEARRADWLIKRLANPMEAFNEGGGDFLRPDLAARDYIPSLLAAWGNPLVTRQLIALMCSNDDAVAETAAMALRGRIEGAAKQLYFASLIENGCQTDAVQRSFLYYGARLTVARRALLDIAAARIDNPRATTHGWYSGPAQQLTLLAWLRPKNSSDALSREADKVVLAAGPGILAGGDENAKKAWAHDVAGPPVTEGALPLLRQLAVQRNDAAEVAMTALCQNADPADLPLFAQLLATDLSTYVPIGELPRNLAKSYGRRAARILRTAMTFAPDLDTREAASVELVKMGDKLAMAAVLAVLRGANQREAVFMLGSLRDAGVPVGAGTMETAVAYLQGQLDAERPH